LEGAELAGSSIRVNSCFTSILCRVLQEGHQASRVQGVFQFLLDLAECTSNSRLHVFIGIALFILVARDAQTFADLSLHFSQTQVERALELAIQARDAIHVNSIRARVFCWILQKCHGTGRVIGVGINHWLVSHHCAVNIFITFHAKLFTNFRLLLIQTKRTSLEGAKLTGSSIRIDSSLAAIFCGILQKGHQARRVQGIFHFCLKKMHGILQVFGDELRVAVHSHLFPNSRLLSVQAQGGALESTEFTPFAIGIHGGRAPIFGGILQKRHQTGWIQRILQLLGVVIVAVAAQ